MNRFTKAIALVGLLNATLGISMVQGATTPEFPTRTVRMLVGFPPGAGVDFAARLVAQKLQEEWGPAVIVENRAGAGGNIAADAVAKAAPDGYTMLLTSPGPIVVNQSLMANMPYDPIKDLLPVTSVASGPNILAVRNDLPAKNVKELIALAKASKDQLNYGSSGMGSTPHMAAELFKMMTNVDMVHVPYKGSADGVTDMIARRLDLMITTMPALMGAVKGGGVRALAVTSLKRNPALPDVPTLNEAGIPGYEFGVWWALFYPANTSAPIVDKLHRSVQNMLKTEDVRAKLAAQNVEVAGNASPREFSDFVRKEAAQWAKVIKTAGIKAN